MKHFASILITLALLGCESEMVEPEPDYMDDLPGRPAAGEWIAVEPGGDTVCSRGTDYRFFVRGGDPSRVIIDFQGGGACWDASNCGFAGALFSDDVGELDTFVAALDAGIIGGIFDGTDGRAFADYTIIHIPYCTGDIHWGDARTEYTDDLTIEHRGFVNASSALDWVYTRYPAASTILVSGCSAGAYGAALHSAYVADHYPDARIAVLADSGAGIITDDFLTRSLPNWNAEPSLPPFIDSLQRPLEELSLVDLYTGIGAHFPNLRMAQTAANWDEDQIFFYVAMGGDPGDWNPRFRESLRTIESTIPNFRAYVPPGSVHCATPYPYFHEREVNGVRLADWTQQLVEGDSMPETVACEGAECCDDPVCDECAATDFAAAHCRFCDTWPPGHAMECD